MASLTASIPDFNFLAAQGASLIGKVVGHFDRFSNNSARPSVHQIQKTTTSPEVASPHMGVVAVPITGFLDLVDDRGNPIDSALADAFNEALFLAEQEEFEIPDDRSWIFALAFLRRIFCDPRSVRLELPLILPLDLGGLSAEWHNHGLNIEIRFRASQPVYVIIEDARAEIRGYRGRDPSLARAFEAIIALALRSN